MMEKMDELNKIYMKESYKHFSLLSDDEKVRMLSNLKNCHDFWNNEIKSRDDLRKNHNKIKNNNVDNYERFRSWNFLEYMSFKVGSEGGFFARDAIRLNTLLSKEHSKGELSDSQLFNLMSVTELGMMTCFFNDDGKVFRINNEILSLLRNTEVKVSYENPCYNHIFLSTKGLIINNVEIFGILMRKRIIDKTNFKDFTKDIEGSNVLEIIIIGIDLEDGENIWFWDTIYETFEDFKKAQDNYQIPINPNSSSWIKDSNRDNILYEIKKITTNFLNLINHQGVELVNKSMKILRDERVKKGRLGIPDNVEINLTGKLKRYVYETTQQNEKAWELGHRFWVRGHWMEFKSERYKNMKGKKVWVLPYIKGKGDLVSKDYYVGEKEQCWEQEKKMIEIVTALYPEEKIEKHNRTVLDGLEIDCYIPSLKLGFEYNGLQHYEHVEIFHKTVEEFDAQKERDIEKRRRAEAKGISIITIKYEELLNEDLIRAKLKQNDKN